MLKLLERSIDAVAERLLILAPPDGDLPDGFEGLVADVDRYNDLVRQLQRFRGRIYVKDGALRPEQLTPDGRHHTLEDLKSWHLVLMDDHGQVEGCIWYFEHEAFPTLDQLRLGKCPLAQNAEWRPKLEAAICADVARACREQIRYGEVGGWAVSETARPADCLLLSLGAYGISQLTGGAFVVTTATSRHSSSQILQRIGGAPLQGDGFTIPPYWDERYQCEMELLRFDSRRPNAKYARLVELLKLKLASAPTICNRAILQNRAVPCSTSVVRPHAAGESTAAA